MNAIQSYHPLLCLFTGSQMKSLEYSCDRGNTRDKEAPKEKGSEKGRAEGEWEDQEVLDYFSDKESGKQKFNDSEGMTQRRQRIMNSSGSQFLQIRSKNFATTSHRNTEEEGQVQVQSFIERQ